MSQNKAFSTPFILAVLCIYFSYFLHGISVITLAQNMTSLAEKFSTDNAGIAYLISVLGLLALTALLVTNSNPQSVAMGIGLILLLGFTCYASRGLYWACPGEARTPSYIMGTTVGICSVIGFLPDVFVYPIIGHWQDTLPAAEAYRNMWLMGMAALAMVIVFTFLLFQKIRTADSAPAMASSK